MRFLYLLQSFTRFQLGLLRNKKDNFCHSQRTWLIPRKTFMLHTFNFSPHSSLFMASFTFHDDVSHAPLSTGVSAARLSIQWSWLRVALDTVRFSGVTFSQNFLLCLCLLPQPFPVISDSLCFSPPESLYPIRSINVFLVRWDLLYDLLWKPCCRDITTIWKFTYEITPQTMHFLARHGFATDSRKDGRVAFQ